MKRLQEGIPRGVRAMLDDGSGPVKPFSNRQQVLLVLLYLYGGWFLANQTAGVDWKGMRILSWFVLLAGIIGALVVTLAGRIARWTAAIQPALRGFSAALVLFLGALHFRGMLFERVTVQGESMIPALLSGESVWINKLATGVEMPDLSFPLGPVWATGKLPKFGLGFVERGDVVVFRYPGYAPSGEYFIKRVIALPGDRYAIRGGEVFVNGEKARESYLAPGIETKPRPDVEGSSIIGFPPELDFLSAEARYAAANGCEPEGVVPPGTLYVLGDNRGASRDSRVMGFIPLFFVRGKVI